MRFVRWLLTAPKIEDPILERRASLLRMLLSTVIVSAGLSLLSSFFIDDPLANIAWTSGFLSIEVGALVAVRLGWVRFATWFVVMGLWAGLVLVGALYGGISGSAPIVFTVVVLLAALALPWRGAVAFTVLCELTMFGMTAFDVWMGRDPYATAFGAWSTIPAIGLLASGAVYALDVALDRAQRRELESRDALERVARSHAYRLGVLNALGEPVLVADSTGTIRYANPSALQLLELSAEEVREHTLSELVTADGSPLRAEQILQTGAVLGTDGTLLTRSGTTVPVQLSATALTGENGEPAVVCCASDLTLRRNATIELERALRMAEEASSAKSRFLANMSHELRTPLNAIIGYSEILIEEPNGPGVEDDLGRIRDSGRHLLALIGDVLDLSKIEAGRMELVLSEVDVAGLLDDVVRTLQPAMSRGRNRLGVDASTDLGRISADALRVRQVLMNLMSNAAKFTTDGTVTLVARRSGAPGAETLRFEVRDTGIGMDDEQLSRVFRPFIQADGSTSRRYGGTGLGLVLARRFAEMMDGSVTIDSAVGVGTCARFVIPIPASVPGRTPLSTPLAPDGRAALRRTSRV